MNLLIKNEYLQPLVLLRYGEFLEEFGEPPRDLLEADHQYTRAVAFSLDNTDTRTQALEGRKRTANKVDLIDDEVLKRIDEKKKKFLKVNQKSEIVKRVKREAYVQYIYHTVGIEGNTMNLAQTRSILETKLAVGGKSIMEHNEILGMDSALKYINSSLVDKIGDVTLTDILEIHRRVLGNVEPVEAGTLRRVQVRSTAHVSRVSALSVSYYLDVKAGHFVSGAGAYSHYPRVPVSRCSWVTTCRRRPGASPRCWTSSCRGSTAGPPSPCTPCGWRPSPTTSWSTSTPGESAGIVTGVTRLALNPECCRVDGNGRTSRLLMNLVLMQAGFPPVIIRRADREVYYQHLVTANEGDIRPFIRFIAECTENTLDAYLWASREYYGPPVGELTGSGGGAELPYNLVEHSLEQVGLIATTNLRS